MSLFELKLIADSGWINGSIVQLRKIKNTYKVVFTDEKDNETNVFVGTSVSDAMSRFEDFEKKLLSGM